MSYIQSIQHLAISVANYLLDLVGIGMPENRYGLFHAKTGHGQRLIDRIHSEPVRLLRNDRRDHLQAMPIRVCLHYDHQGGAGPNQLFECVDVGPQPLAVNLNPGQHA